MKFTDVKKPTTSTNPEEVPDETKAQRKFFCRCRVPQCHTFNAQKGFYQIPEHPTRRQAWLDACKLPKDTPKAIKICWKHFLLTDFRNEVTEENIKECKFGPLKKNVVPSQNLPEDAHFSPTNTHEFQKMGQKNLLLLSKNDFFLNS